MDISPTSEEMKKLSSILSPSYSSDPFHTIAINTAPVDDLNNDLSTIKDQVEQLKDEVAGKVELAEINQRLDKMATSIESATERGQELKAKVLLPPPDHLNVQLVPSYSLDRLEEYRADEKRLYIFLGVFLGGIIGILSNLATQDSFKINRAASVLLAMFIFLTFCLAFWAFVINKRVQKIRDQIFLTNSSNTQSSSKKNDSAQNTSDVSDKQSLEKTT